MQLVIPIIAFRSLQRSPLREDGCMQCRFSVSTLRILGGLLDYVLTHALMFHNDLAHLHHATRGLGHFNG